MCIRDRDVDILHPLVLHKVGEALALHTGHVEDIGISDDFFRKVRMFHVLDVVLAAVDFVFFGHPQLVGSDEVESGVEVALSLIHIWDRFLPASVSRRRM